MIDGPGLRFLDECQMGIDELQWAKEYNNSLARTWRLQHMMRAGFLTRRQPHGAKDYAWLCAQEGGGSGKLYVRRNSDSQAVVPNTTPTTLFAIDVDGYLIEFDGVPYATGSSPDTATYLQDDSETDLAVPDDGVWRTLVMRREVTTREKGTLALTTGAATVTGTRTEMTRFNGYTTDGYDRGTRIKIAAADSSNGNEGTYEIDTITSDTALALRTNANGTTESGLPFSVVGDFSGTVPSDDAIHHRVRAVFELVTRTREPSNSDLIVADVMLDTGVSNDVQIIDRRQSNRYLRRRGDEARVALTAQPKIAFATATPYTSASLDRSEIYNGGVSGAVWLSAAPFDQGLLVVVEDDGQKIVTQKFTGGTWAAAGNVDTSGSAESPAIIQVPSASGNTHLCFYVKSDTLYMRGSDDEGATWGSEAQIWDPSAVDANDRVEFPAAIQLLNGRIVVAAGYYDDTADSGSGQVQIRFITSDDYGTTWATNTNAGTTYIDNNASGTYYDCTKPSMWQSEGGHLWMVFDEDATDARVLLSYYDSTLGDNPDAAAPTRKGFAANSSLACYDASVFCDARGNALFFYAAYAANSLTVDMATMGAAGPTGEVTLFTVNGGGPVSKAEVCTRVVQEPGSGELHLFFIDPTTSPEGVDHVRLRLGLTPAEWTAWE